MERGMAAIRGGGRRTKKRAISISAINSINKERERAMSAGGAGSNSPVVSRNGGKRTNNLKHRKPSKEGGQNSGGSPRFNGSS